MDPTPRIDTLMKAQELADAGLDPKAAKAIVALLDYSLRAGTISRVELAIFEARIAQSETRMTGMLIAIVVCLLAFLGAAVNFDRLIDVFG